MIENYDNKKIQSFEYETTAISDGNIIGTCELGNATIQMINDSNEYSSLKGQWIKTIHGSFYIHDVEPVQEKVNIKLSCYDIKYKLDTPYDSSLYTWPMTLKQWRNAIGTNCGITFDNGDFPNSGMELSAEPYVGDNPSNRNVISQIAQAGCSFVDTDKDDIFYFKWFEDATHQVDDWLELTTEKEISKQVNVVVLGRGDTEDNVCYPTTKPTNPVEFRIDNNYILDPQIEGQDQRYDVIKQIYNRVNGFSYLVFNMRTQNVQNKLSIALGQKVSYKDIWGNNLNSYIMSKKVTYLGGDPTDDDNYEITLSAEEIKETSTELSYSASIENKILKVERIANKQEGKIQDIITEQNEHSSKINTLEMTSSSTLSKISNVEKEVDTLSDDIDGVSADFKNFKDNEYIQSINNLQDQIDGAIQFWNGAEIPTLENYPTNDWTTENDKINHQADIYTVIQDVEGEMKQGKSYRFDKINGVWQWIELTDNELSAVQAIAQEALDKADANATEIGTVKTRVSSLEQTDEQIKASVESIDKQIIPTSKVSGSNIHIEDASDKKMVNFEIEGKSTQKTRSGNNLLKFSSNRKPGYSISTGGLTFTINNDYSITVNGTNDGSNSYIYIMTGETLSLPIGTYIGGLYNNDFQLIGYDGTKDYYLWNVNTLPSEVNFNDIYIQININSKGKTFNNVILKPIIVSGESLPAYEPYGVSPSPDYPSEIESVGYENLVEETLTGMNINNSGQITRASFDMFIAKVEKDKTYTISVDDITGVVCGFFTSKPTLYSISYNNSRLIQESSMTIIAPITGYIAFRGTSGYQYAQLTEGTQPHPYIPYGKYGIEVKNTGKNILNIRNLIIENADITYSGYGFASFKITNKIGQFTISRENNNMYSTAGYLAIGQGIDLKSAYNNKKWIMHPSISYLNSKSATLSNTGELWIFTSNTQINISNTIENAKYLQIEEGPEATEYEPYQSSSSLFVLDQPLRSLPNGVKDIAYIKNNILCVDRKVGSKIFDGSEDWVLQETMSNGKVVFRQKTLFLDSAGSSSRGLCNYLPFDNTVYSASNNKIGFYFNEFKVMNFVILSTTASTINEFKTWLSTHNTQVDYELAEPYIEKIGEVEIPSTFKGVNNITTTDELEPVMNIEYVRDTILSDYVEGQVSNAVAIQERKNAEFQITNEEIKSTVSAISTNLDGTKSSLKSVEEKITSQEKTIKIISKNIDSTTGNITEVTTTNGFTFNSNGLKIYIDENSYNTVIDNVGTYYKDGDEVINQTTKDGSILTNLSEKGQTKYSYNENDDYDFIEERVESDGEYAYATFYNGEE